MRSPLLLPMTSPAAAPAAPSEAASPAFEATPWTTLALGEIFVAAYAASRPASEARHRLSPPPNSLWGGTFWLFVGDGGAITPVRGLLLTCASLLVVAALVRTAERAYQRRLHALTTVDDGRPPPPKTLPKQPARAPSPAAEESKQQLKKPRPPSSLRNVTKAPPAPSAPATAPASWLAWLQGDRGSASTATPPTVRKAAAPMGSMKRPAGQSQLWAGPPGAKKSMV